MRPQITFDKVRKPNVGGFCHFYLYKQPNVSDLLCSHVFFSKNIQRNSILIRSNFFTLLCSMTANYARNVTFTVKHIRVNLVKFCQIILLLTKNTSKLDMAKLRAKFVTLTFAFVQKIIKIDLAKFRKFLSPSLLRKAKFFKNVKFIIEPCAFFQKCVKNITSAV